MRPFVLLVLMAASFTACGDDSMTSPGRPMQGEPTVSATPSPPSPEERPTPNVRASSIRVLRSEEGDHPAPEVLPRWPLDLVVGECEGLIIPPNDDSALDEERKILIVYWWDPGVRAGRSLTILYETPSCSEHRQLSTYLRP